MEKTEELKLDSRCLCSCKCSTRVSKTHMYHSPIN